MSWYNSREKYTDFEISKMLNKKLNLLKMSKEDFYNEYKSEFLELTFGDVINMFDEKTYFNTLMLEVAAKFLSIPYDEITDLIEDEECVDFRADGEIDEDCIGFWNLTNVIFSEMIKADIEAKLGEK